MIDRPVRRSVAACKVATSLWPCSTYAIIQPVKRFAAARTFSNPLLICCRPVRVPGSTILLVPVFRGLPARWFGQKLKKACMFEILADWRPRKGEFSPQRGVLPHLPTVRERPMNDQEPLFYIVRGSFTYPENLVIFSPDSFSL